MEILLGRPIGFGYWNEVKYRGLRLVSGFWADEINIGRQLINVQRYQQIICIREP